MRFIFKNKPIYKGQNFKIYKSTIEEFDKNFILTNKLLYNDIKIPNNYDEFLNKVLVFEQKINWYDKNQKSKLFIKEGMEELLNALKLFKLTGKNSHFIMKIKEIECAFDNDEFNKKTDIYDLDYIDKNQFNL